MRKRTPLLLLILCGILLQTACTREDTPPVPEPTIFDIGEVAFVDTSVVFSEAPHSSFGAFGLNKNMDRYDLRLRAHRFPGGPCRLH